MYSAGQSDGSQKRVNNKCVCETAMSQDWNRKAYFCIRHWNNIQKASHHMCVQSFLVECRVERGVIFKYTAIISPLSFLTVRNATNLIFYAS